MGFEAETEKINYFNKMKRINMLSASEDFQLRISKQGRRRHHLVQFHQYVSVYSSGLLLHKQHCMRAQSHAKKSI